MKEWQQRWLSDNKLVYELENIHYKSSELQIGTWYKILAFKSGSEHHAQVLSTYLGLIGRYEGTQGIGIYTFYECYRIDGSYTYSEWEGFGDHFLYSKIYIPELPEEDIKRIILEPTRFADE